VTSRPRGWCEYASESNAAAHNVLLKVESGMGEGYDWVTCNACETSWQVMHYAAESVG
jgi:hypothetical protein